jgi:hypothetical protein
MFFLGSTHISGVLSPNVSVMLPPPTPMSIIQFTTLDGIDSQTKHISYIAPVISNRPHKILLTGEQVDTFSQISSEFRDGLISIEEAMLKLRGGGKFKEISLIVLYIWLYRLQNNHVEGFQPIRLPHQEWMPKGADQRPPYAGGYVSSNSGSSLGLTDTNDGFDNLISTQIKKVYSQIPNLWVEGTNEQITAWSVAKHIHHAPAFGLDPADYDMTQQDLDNIAQKGLINHIRYGGTPPNAEYIEALQKVWKRVAEHKTVTRLEDQIVMGKECTVLKQMQSGHFVAFEKDSGESFTGYRLTPFQSNQHDRTGIIGKNYSKK